MSISDERLNEMLDSYTWLERNPTHSGRNERAQMDAEHASLLRELQHCRSRYCPDCNGVGWFANPSAHWHRAPDGTEYCDGPEEIDCPRCKGGGFVAPPQPLPTPYLPPERDDGMPF